MDDEPARRTLPNLGLIGKALSLLDAVTMDGGDRSIVAIAREVGIPQATAYRLIAELVENGLLIGVGRGRYLAGPRLVDYAGRADPLQMLARLARPAVAQIARRFRQDVHLAIMEGGMVTYLVKAGAGSAAAFARQGMQLEAYCSGVGKILLAHLSEPDLDEYLANGPFIRLTANTIVEPDALREHLGAVRARGYAVDDEEIAEGLKCLAVPVRDHHGHVIAALSLSGRAAWMTPARMAAVHASLASAAGVLHSALSGGPRNS